LNDTAQIRPRTEVCAAIHHEVYFEMLLFLDTEYTGFDSPTPRLISLGIVTEDGQREFYVELNDTWTEADCSQFVKRGVLPVLDGNAVSLEQARARLLDWLAASPRSVRVACDSQTDFRFLMTLIGDTTLRNLAPAPFDLRPLIDTVVYHEAVMTYYRTDNREHHALVDARAYRKGWLAWMAAKKRGTHG
jgi:hypothetical protein